jgi:hypothetical protein
MTGGLVVNQLLAVGVFLDQQKAAVAFDDRGDGQPRCSNPWFMSPLRQRAWHGERAAQIAFLEAARLIVGVQHFQLGLDLGIDVFAVTFATQSAAVGMAFI